MKILMLVPFLPNTSMSGGQTRWYNIIKYLSKNHEITLFSLIKEDSERRFIPELEKYCRKVMIFKRPKSPWSLRNIIMATLGPYPLLVVRNWSFSERRAIEEELVKNHYDLIHAETFYVMPHLPRAKIPSILVEQTIEYMVYKHYVDNEVSGLFKPLFMWDVVKLKYWERYFWKKATKLVVVSSEDKKIMEKDLSTVDVSIIPNGIDASYFAEKVAERITPPRVLFVGNFKWLQNTEAATVLIEKVWPLIIKRVPEAKLWIVGKSIPIKIQEIAKEEKDIEVTESLPDIREAYQAATVMTVPIYGPGGTRLKVLEALASGLPVVSTPTGIAGLNLTADEHALVGKDYDELAQKTISVLRSQKFGKRLGQAGRAKVIENYDWKSIVKLHEPIYRQVLENK